MATKKLILSYCYVVLLFTILPSSDVFAHQKGDLFVRAGLNIMSNETVRVSGNIGKLELNSDATATGTLTYMLSDTKGVEASLSSYFTKELSHSDISAGVEMSQLLFLVAFQHYFAEIDSDIRPYMGVGFNYTTFVGEEGKGNWEEADISVDASFSYVIQAGIDYMMTDDLFVNFSIWYLDIETDVYVDGSPMITKPIEARVDPITFMISAGYTF